jgi:hypothetical protein
LGNTSKTRTRHDSHKIYPEVEPPEDDSNNYNYNGKQVFNKVIHDYVSNRMPHNMPSSHFMPDDSDIFQSQSSHHSKEPKEVNIVDNFKQKIR